MNKFFKNAMIGMQIMVVGVTIEYQINKFFKI